jgi:hypothetical protein
MHGCAGGEIPRLPVIKSNAANGPRNMMDDLETPELDDGIQWGEDVFSYQPNLGKRLLAAARRGKVIRTEA